MSFGFPPLLNTRSRISKKAISSFWFLFGWPSFIRRLQWPTVVRLLDANSQMEIADIGAGPMQYSIELAKKTRAKVYAIDISLNDTAYYYKRKFGIIPVQADALSLPFNSRKFDRVLMSSLIQMVPNPDSLLKEVHRVLKENGHIVLSVPSEYLYLPNFHKKRFIRCLFRLPSDFTNFKTSLNKRFKVHGPKGYYSREDIEALLSQNGFIVTEHSCSPGALGSVLWEIGILFYWRFGSISFHCLFFLFPFVALFNRSKTLRGSEYIIRAERTT